MSVVMPKEQMGFFSIVEQKAKAITNPLTRLFQQHSPTAETSSRVDKWERVLVKKMDASGAYYKCRNTAGATIEGDALFEYVVHKPSGTLYLDEPQYVVALKSLLIALANPIFAGCRTIWHLGRIVVSTAVIAARCMQQLFSERGKEKSAASLLYKNLQILKEVVLRDMYRALTTPIFAVGVEIGALIGIFAPYEGRRIIGEVEKRSQEGKGIKEAHCLIDDYDSGLIQSFEDFAQALIKREVCYLAFCFQPRGNLNDTKKYELQSRMPITYF